MSVRDLILQLRDALATAIERYGMIDPDHPGDAEDDSEADDDDPIHAEAEQIDAAINAADAFLAEQGTEIKLSRPLFRLHQWPLRTLIHDVPGRVTIVGEPLSVDPRDQLSLAAAVLRGWPVVVTVRRLAGGAAYRPLDQRSARVLGALMALTNPHMCAVYLVQDSMGSALTLEPNDLTLATILDHKARWETGRALKAAGHDGQANRLEHLATAWSDYLLTVHEVLDLPAADEIAAWMDRST